MYEINHLSETGSSFDDLIGRFSSSNGPGLLYPMISRKQSSDAFPGIYGLASDEAESWSIRRIYGFEFEEMASKGIQFVMPKSEKKIPAT